MADSLEILASERNEVQRQNASESLFLVVTRKDTDGDRARKRLGYDSAERFIRC